VRVSRKWEAEKEELIATERYRAVMAENERRRGEKEKGREGRRKKGRTMEERAKSR
jgi:hypothetical protein